MTRHKIEIKPLWVKVVSDNKLNELIKIVIKNGYLCGSRKFELSNSRSDWDYVIKSDLVCDYLDIEGLIKYNENSQLPTLSAKILIENEELDEIKIINILVTISDNEYDAWVKSTEQFVELLKNDTFKEIVKDKLTRVSIFERLRQLNGIGDRI